MSTKIEKKKLLSCKRGFAWLLSAALVFTSVNLTPLTANAEETDEVVAAPVEGAVDLQAAKTELWVGGSNNWGNSACTMEEEADQVTFNVTNFGD